MCMQCVAQGAPYVVGSVAGLRAMAFNAKRARIRRTTRSERPADAAPVSVDPVATPAAATAPR
jgi:hypothetical protein